MTMYFIRRPFWALLLLVILGAGTALGASAQAPPTPLQLLGRADSTAAPIRVAGCHQPWLQSRDHLVLGTSAPDYPPFDLTSSGSDYEGLTADYAAIVEKTLGLPIKVVRLADRAAALQALRSGDIDILGSANSFEAAQPGIILSNAYAADRPALVMRNDDQRPLSDDLDGLRLSVLDHYLPAQRIRERYPKAIIQFYTSYPEALSAVAFGQADVFLGDTLGAYQQLEKGYLPNVQIRQFGEHESTGFGFALRDDNTLLRDALNATLCAIAASTRASILRRWSPGSRALLDEAGLPLTPQERQWLRDHPVVRIAVSEAFAPLTFFDQQGQLRGVSADLLELIRLRTGLRFEPQRSATVETLMVQVESGKADLVAALIPSEERRQRLRFSAPYLITPYALLSANLPGSPTSLAELAQRRLAVNRGSPLLAYLRSEFPDIHLIEADDSFATLDLVAQGEADAAISTLVTATYFMGSHLFQDRLRIRSTLSIEQADFAFAVARDATELGAIIDKALASISPEQLAIVTGRWRGYNPPADTYWRNYHRLILQISVVAALLVLAAAAWALLTRQTLRRQQASQRALNDQLRLMHALVEGTPHPVYIRDRDGVLQSCNASYLESIQASRDSVIGKRLSEAPMAEDPEAALFEQDYRQVMSEAQPLIVDRTVNIGGRAVTIYHWVQPYHDSTGAVCGIVGGWIDISERRQLFEELRYAKDQADAASRAKSTFLATMSHEIRTPLNAVIGLLELALERADRGQLDRNGLHVAHSCAGGLLELIGDILDIARIESGHMNISPKRVDLRELVESVVRVFDGVARQKGLDLLLEIDQRAQQQDVLLDPLRVKQVLSNLISNAIKFTAQGQVAVRLRLHDEGDSLYLQLEVQDSGVGISAADQAQLFKPFAQIASPQRGNAQGAGLGLLICSGLCEAMGARLRLESSPGAGTLASMRVHVTPLEPIPREAATPALARTVTPGLEVLVVDDNAANRLLTTQQLEHLDLQPITATCAEEGMQHWLEQHFDVVIVDCSMPDIDGYQFARMLRELEQQRQRPRCTLLGYTANAQPEEHQRCLDAGMDDCLFKPLTLRALNDQLCQIQRLPGNLPFRPEALDLMTGGDPEQIQRLLRQIHLGCQSDLLALQAPHLAEDPQALNALAHKILGAARIVDAQAVCSACLAVTQATNTVQRNTSRLYLTQALTGLEKAIGAALHPSFDGALH